MGRESVRGEEWGEGLQGTVIAFTPEQNELSDHSVRVRTKRVYMIVEAEGNSHTPRLLWDAPRRSRWRGGTGRRKESLSLNEGKA